MSLMVKYMIDSNIWDSVFTKFEVQLLLETLVARDKIRLFGTSIQDMEISAAPEATKLQDLIEKLQLQKVPSSGFILDFSRLDVDRFGPESSRWVDEHGKNHRDQVIGQTAEKIGATLVTNDKRLRKRAQSLEYPTRDFEEFLEELRQLDQ